jgi:uncharacterized coiled-coil protein SlyX
VTDEDRLLALEERAAYQDRLIAELEAVVREFADRTEKLEREIAELKTTLRDGVPDVGRHDEEPPHY